MAVAACAAGCATSRAPPCSKQQSGGRRCHSRRHTGRPASLSSVVCSALPRVTLHDAYDRLIPYEEAWRWQKDLVEEVCASSSSSAGEEPNSSSSSSAANGSSSAKSSAEPPSVGSLLLLQHPPVYTLGAGATEGHLKFDPAVPPHPLYRTERGGEVTYHGPGQLVLYPILDLRRPPLQADLHWYLRSLEEVVIRTLDAVSGLHGERIPGLTGVWVDGRKVAAMGVRATRWVTFHGLALNVVTDLSPFGHIVPCGIGDRKVASVEGLLAAQAAATEGGGGGSEAWAGPRAAGFEPLLGAAAALKGQQQQLVQRPEAASLEADQLLDEYRHGLLEAFQEVFGVELVAAEGSAASGGPAQPAVVAAAQR